MARAPVRYSDSERFSLAYELEAVGNYGVEAIELYGSLDGGKSWSLWGQDPDRNSPFDIETKEAAFYGSPGWTANVDKIRGHLAHRDIKLIRSA